MEDVPERQYTPVHATHLGTRYVLLSDIPARLQDHCELFARGRRALLLLPDGSTALFYEDWLIWAEALDDGSGLPSATSGGFLGAESTKLYTAVPRFQCDRCGAVAQYSIDDGLTNLHQLSFDAGIGNALGDKKRLDLDICNGCLKETFGPWFRVASIG